MIKVVFMDVDNTLLDFNESAKAAMIGAFEGYNMPVPDELFVVFEEVNTLLWEQVQRSEIDLKELYRIRWNMIFSKLHLRIDGVEFEQKFLDLLATSAIAVKGAYEVLNRLSKKYILCIASNAPYEQQLKRLEKADMLQYFSFVFISEKIGFEKPSVNFFNACFSELGNVSAHEAIMIGDSISADIVGAKSVGMRTCWYNHNHIEGNASSDNCADYVINDLLAIADIL